MANDFYDIIARHGSKPVELIVGVNPDGDIRHKISVSYHFGGQERNRVWLTRTQLETIFAILNDFLHGSEVGDDADETADAVTGNGTEPPS